MIILLLIFAYSNNSKGSNEFIKGLIFVIGYCALFVVSMTDYLPFFILTKIYTSNLLIILGARLPQIYAIFVAKSTGNNAFITWFLNFGGALARLFTTLQEVDDMMALVVICASVVCNGIIVLQFAIYWNADVKKKEKKKKQ